MEKVYENRQVRLHIKGTQTDKMEQKEIIRDFFIEGTMQKSEKELILQYAEPAEHGMGNVETTLRYDGEIFILERNGESNLLIQKDKRHICQYRTAMGDIFVGVNGGNISLDMDEKRIDMEINYCIDINSSFAARNRIEINAFLEN